MLHNLLLAVNRVNLTEPIVPLAVFLPSYLYSESEIFIYSLKYVIFITKGMGTDLYSYHNIFGQFDI